MTTDVVRQITDRIAPDFELLFSRETTQQIVAESLDELTEQATVAAWLPTFVERFARDRLRALAKTEHLVDDERPAVLFLCVHNAGRSQMAAGLLRHASGGAIAVYSGGSEPASEINPVAVRAMTEIGIDIANEFPKPWTNEVVGAVDVVVSMGCGDACPVLPGKCYVEWELEDPAGKPIEVVRRVREEIGRRVANLVSELGVEPRSV
jgi:protein-tyrosine-phosphatase